MRELNDTEKSLLKNVTSDAIKTLSKDTGISEVKEMCFGWYDEALDQEYQVQILVTRDETDFIEPFTSVCTTNIKHKA